MSVLINDVECFQYDNESFSQFYNKNGELLVLLHKNHGCGWSTQENGKRQLQLASDATIIRLFLNHYQDKKNKELTEEELLPAKQFFDKNFKYLFYEHINKLSLCFILKNKTFQIREYDGLEKIFYYRPLDWFTPLKF